MRLIVLFVGLMIVGAMPVMAQETIPGAACTAGETNFIDQSGGPETSGVLRILRCDGANWQQYLTILADGKIGIGTDSPQSVLHIGAAPNMLSVSNGITFGDGDTGIHEIQDDRIEFSFPVKRIIFDDDGIGSPTGFSARIKLNPTANEVHYGIKEDVGTGLRLLGSQTLALRTANTNAIFIDSAQNVGIGTTSPNVELDVEGSIEFTGTIRDMSDRRQKTDIRVITDALEAVSKINGVAFKMKEGDGSTEMGLIAQDVEAVYPELVYTGSDGIKALNYQGMIGPLVEAVKELNAQNSLLRADLSEKEQKLAEKDRELAKLIHTLSARMDVLEGTRRPPLKPYNP